MLFFPDSAEFALTDAIPQGKFGICQEKKKLNHNERVCHASTCRDLISKIHIAKQDLGQLLPMMRSVWYDSTPTGNKVKIPESDPCLPFRTLNVNKNRKLQKNLNAELTVLGSMLTDFLAKN